MKKHVHIYFPFKVEMSKYINGSLFWWNFCFQDLATQRYVTGFPRKTHILK